MQTFESVREELLGLEQAVATEKLTTEANLVAANAELDALKAAIAAAMAAEAAKAAEVEVEPLVVDVPKTIVSDGSVDVAGELSSFLNSVPGPAIVRFPAFSTYRVDDAAVVVNTPVGITYDFCGSTLLRTRVIDQKLRYPERHGFFRLMHPDHVTVKNLRVKGAVTNDGSMNAYADLTKDDKPYLLDKRGASRLLDTQAGLLPPFWPTPGDWGVYSVALAFEHAVDISGGTNVIVEDCWFDGIGGDGVGTTLDTTRNLTVRRVTVRRNGRQGISLCAGNGFLIEDCDIRSVRAAIDLEPDTADTPMTNIEIRGCTLASNLLPFASGGPGEIHDVFIHRNRITKGGVPTLHVMSNGGTHERRNWRFEDNIVEPALSSAAPLVRMTNVHGASILRNSIARRATEAAGRLTAVALDRCSGVTVDANIFRRADPVVVETNPVSPALVGQNTV